MSKSGRALTYVKNWIRDIGWKSKYGNGVSIASRQLFDQKPFVKVLNKGSIKIGSLTSNRGRQFFICDGGRMSIGKGCFFNDGCSVTCMDELTIGDRCTFANNVIIVDHDHDFRQNKGEYKATPVSIGNNVWVGANSVILRGAVIGAGSVVAAGTVVTKGTYPQNSLIREKRELIVEPIVRQ